MISRLGVAFGLVVLLVGAAACDDGDAPADVRRAMLSDMAARVITPGHAQFVTDATALEAAVAALEADPTAATLATAQQAWRTAARSWPRLAALNLPGVKFGLYHNRIATRPANVEAVTDALSGSDTIDLAFIQSRGSNARGLPVLESLLFGGADPLADFQDERRRAYARAVSEDIREQAEALETKWSAEGGDEIGMFIAADTEGRNLQSSVSRIVNEIAMVAEDLQDIAIGRPMGIARNPEDPNSDPRPELVEAPYAEASVAIYRETLAGLRALMTANDGTGLDDYLIALDAQIDGQPVGAAVLAEIDATDAAIAALDVSLRTSIETDPEAVRAVYDQAGDLLRIVRVDLANWLGVSITFSDNDGGSG